MKKLSSEEIADLQAAIKHQKDSVFNSTSTHCTECGNYTCTCEYKKMRVEKARQGVTDSAERESRFFNGLGGVLFMLLIALVLKALNLI